MQLGRYAEYFAKMEFTMFGFEVFSSEVDDRGIDFIARSPGGSFMAVQVKSVLKTNYVFMQKSKFKLDSSTYLALLTFEEGQEPEMFLIPSAVWWSPNALFVDRDYEGLKSKPEWGVSLSKKNLPMLEPFRFETVAKRFLA